MKKIIIILMLAFVLTVLSAVDPVITNPIVSQSTDGTKIVTITYDLAYDGSADLYVDLYLSTDSGVTFSDTKMESNLTGDFGEGVEVGAKTVTWDISSEVAYEASTYRIKLIADESAPPFQDDFINIPTGSFTMGRTTGSGDSDELPTHIVYLSGYYVSKYEVTQSEWTAVMGSNPSAWSGKGDNYPVNQVNWYNSLKYCNKLSISVGLTPVYSVDEDTNTDNWGSTFTPTQDLSANGYRLLTEAEWEYAARGATNDPDYLYSGSDTIGDVAWYSGTNSPYGCKPVGTKDPNALGIYDMSGNLNEWCWDYNGSYSSSEQTNPTGPESGTVRLIRGGYWRDSVTRCRVANRNTNGAEYGSGYIGIRLGRTAEQ